MYFFERHKGPAEGYCRICGNFSKLTSDHVPPKSCSNLGVYIIKDWANTARHLKTQNGISFRTICAKCNNEGLGSLDPELAKFSDHVKKFLKSRASGINFPQGYKIFVSCKTIVRCVAGHILAAHDGTEKLSERLHHADFPYLSDLHRLYEGQNLSHYTIGAWIHNFPTVNIYPSAGISTPFSKAPPSMFSLLSFFPLGFMIIHRRYQPRNIPFHRLRTDQDSIEIDLMSLTKHSPRYPLDNLRTEMVIFDSGHIYTAEKWPKVYF